VAWVADGKPRTTPQISHWRWFPAGRYVPLRIV